MLLYHSSEFTDFPYRAMFALALKVPPATEYCRSNRVHNGSEVHLLDHGCQSCQGSGLHCPQCSYCVEKPETQERKHAIPDQYASECELSL